nr:MAG: hypothetical protein [Aspergillus flavus vivivirus 1]
MAMHARRMQMYEELGRKGEKGPCPCYDGAPAYLLLFDEEMHKEVYAKLGNHPRLADLQDLYWKCGLYYTDHVRLVKLNEGITMIEDYDGFSCHFVSEVFEFPSVPDYLLPALDDVRVLTTRHCCFDDVVPYHEREGFCYLKLYPREIQAQIAKALGPWPSVRDLPSGRFPAVTKEVIGEVVSSHTLRRMVHVEAVCRDGRDELLDYPPSAVVGGMSRNNHPELAPRRVGRTRLCFNKPLGVGQKYYSRVTKVEFPDGQDEVRYNVDDLMHWFVLDGDTSFWSIEFEQHSRVQVETAGYMFEPGGEAEIVGVGKAEFLMESQKCETVCFRRRYDDHRLTLPYRFRDLDALIEFPNDERGRDRRRRLPDELSFSGSIAVLDEDRGYSFESGVRSYLVAAGGAVTQLRDVLALQPGYHVGVLAGGSTGEGHDLQVAHVPRDPEKQRKALCEMAVKLPAKVVATLARVSPSAGAVFVGAFLSPEAEVYQPDVPHHAAYVVKLSVVG